MACVVCVLGGFLAVPAVAMGACTDSWKAAVNGSWSTASDWSTGMVPAGSDDVCITAPGNYTVQLQGGQPTINSLTLGAGSGSTTQTLAVQGVPGQNSVLSLAANSTVKTTGKLVLDSQSSGGIAELAGASTNVLSNSGSIVSQWEGGSGNFLEMGLTNNPGGSVDVQTGTLAQNQGTTSTNDGSWTVDPGASETLSTGTASFLNDGGHVNDNGSITLTNGASWSQAGGSETGNAVTMFSGTFDDGGSASSGSFELVDGVNVTGTIAAAETVSLAGVPGHNASGNVVGGLTNDGTIILDSPSGGGSATLTGNPVINDGTIDTQDASSHDFLEANLTNNGTVNVQSGELRQDGATTTTNNGTFTTATSISPGYTLTNGGASFVNDTGASVANSGAITLSSGASWTQNGGRETGKAVSMFSGTLTDAGTGPSGSFDLIDGPTISGTIAPGETVDLTGIPGHNAVGFLASPGVINNGTLILDSQSGGGYSDLTGSPLTNNATLRSQVAGGNLDYLEVNLNNSASGAVTVTSGELRQDIATTTTNDGSVTTSGGAAFNLTTGPALFVNDTGATVADAGSITLTNGASWQQAGGAETGNPVTMYGGGLTDNGAGSGSFDLIDGPSVTGTIGGGETVDVTGIPGHNADAILAGPGVTNDGTIILDSQSGGGWADVSGGTLTNNGTLRTQVEGGNLDYLEANLDNSASGALTVASGEFRQDNGTSTTNDGSVTTNSGGAFNLTTGSALFVNDTGASVANSGTITLSNGASWTQNGGSETGNAVTMYGGGLTDNGAGSGGFDLIDSATISGTIAPGEIVDLTAIPGHNAVGGLASPGVINNGTLILDSQSGGGYADLIGNTLTNNGTLRTQVEGGNLDYLEANLNNSGTVDVATGELRQDQGTTTTNDGNVTLASTGQFNLTTSPAVFDQQTSGTMNFDISGASTFGTLNLSNGAGLQLNGGAVGAVLQSGYTPAVGTEFDVITGSGPWGPGTFGTVTNGYTADYANLTFIGLVLSHVSSATAIASSGSPTSYGAPVTFTATVTKGPGGSTNPTGTVTFLDNGTSIGTGTLSTTGGVTTAKLSTSALPGGPDPITASYGGDSKYAASASAATNQVVNRAATSTSLASTHNPSTYGQSLTLTATITPSPSGPAGPSGTVTFFDNGIAIGTGSASTTGGVTKATLTTAGLGVGTHPITASYGGDANYTGSTSTPAVNQVVNRAATSTSIVGGSPNPSVVGQSVTFTARVVQSAGAANPTGTVTFFDNGSSIGTGSLSTSAGVTTAKLSTSALTFGTHSITASYGGDSNYLSSPTSPAVSQVVKLSGTTTSLGSSGSPSSVGQPVTFTATVTHSGGGPSPTGTVTFYDNGSSIGTRTLATAGGTTTAALTTSSLAAGTHPITAAYAGDSNYVASTSSPSSQTVNLNATSTALASSQNPSTSGQPVTFTATVTHTTGSSNPTGSVTFFDNGAAIGTGTLSTAGGVSAATLMTSSLSVGTHPITASYGGASIYAASSSTPALAQVIKSVVHNGQNHPLTVSGAGQGGSVSVNGTPCNANCSFSYGNGQVVTLTAQAKPGWTFAGWSGGGCIGTGSCVVTMSAAQHVQALFIHVPPPVFQHNSDAATVSGQVTIRLPGTNRFIPLSKARQIPLGAVIDATHGVVQVVLAKKGGGTLEAQYWTGQFSLSQARSGQVTAKLQGGNLPACRALIGHARDARIASHKPRHRRRSLWSNVHGTFTTQGSYASGSVRGTKWVTVDYCEGTSVTVARGAVLVTDLRRHRSTLVRAGHSIFVSS